MTGDTELLRQVNPAWLQADRITSQVFKPTPKDGSLLSVYNGDLVDARQSWTHFTRGLGFLSSGVVAVTVRECSSLELMAREDPTPFPEHAVIDFAGFSRKQIERKAKKLSGYAQVRGWKFRPI